jgi:hypothetical protein
MAFLCVSQQGEFKNIIHFFLGEIDVGKKMPKNMLFPFDFFYRVFFAVSLHEELKNTIKMFSKVEPENLQKKTQKKYHGTCLGFFPLFFLSAPRKPPPQGGGGGGGGKSRVGRWAWGFVNVNARGVRRLGFFGG